MYESQMTQSFAVSFHSINEVTKHEPENTYDYVVIKPLTTGDNQVDKPAAKEKMMMATNPNDDEQYYATMNFQSEQINTDNIKMDSNPAYAEANFT